MGDEAIAFLPDPRPGCFERSWVFAGTSPAFLTASMYLAEVPNVSMPSSATIAAASAEVMKSKSDCRSAGTAVTPGMRGSTMIASSSAVTTAGWNAHSLSPSGSSRSSFAKAAGFSAGGCLPESRMSWSLVG